MDQHLSKLEQIIKDSGELLEGNCMYLHNSMDTHPDLLPKQRNLQRAAIDGAAAEFGLNKILEIGFNAGHSALLFLTGAADSIVDVFDLGEHAYTRKCFEYLQSQFPGRLHLPMGWGDSQVLLPQYVVKIMGTPEATYRLVHIDGSHDVEDVRNDILYSRFLLRNCGGPELIIDDVWIPSLAVLYQELQDRNIIKVSKSEWEPTPMYQHALCGFIIPKIAILSLHVGERFREVTKYSLLSKIQYCMQHGYDLIIDESVVDHTRPYAWSKVELIQNYIGTYDHVAWIDADTLIMNPEKKLEEFIDQYQGTNDILLGYDRERFNTGVMFIKNTDWSIRFFSDVYEQDQFIDNGYWEQAAIIHLFDQNWMNAKHHITATWHTAFNSYYYNYEWGHFIIHFPGCRPLDALNLAMYKYCPVKKFDEAEETFQRRKYWIQYESKEYENLKISSGFTVM